MLPGLKANMKTNSGKIGDLYPFNTLDFNVNEVLDNNKGVISSLTLFAPFPHEDETERPATVLLERPVTPINNEVKGPPSTYSKLGKLVRRRIGTRPNAEHLGVEEQQELAAVIMGEVNCIWSDLHKQVDDPFLSAGENKELHRRITVHVVTACQELFDHYLDKVQVLNKRGVFSGPANMSRLKTQLAIDCNKYLHILTIRRHIVKDLRGLRALDTSDGEEGEDATWEKATIGGRSPRLSTKNLLEASRSVSRRSRKSFSTPEQHMAQLQKMPDLDTAKLSSVLKDFPREAAVQKGRYDSDARLLDDASYVSDEEKRPHLPHHSSYQPSGLRRCESVPALQHGESLLEELGVARDSGRVTSLEDVPEDEFSPIEAAAERKAEDDPWERKQRDLQRLASRGQTEAASEEDLPALLQAVTSSDRQLERRREIDARLEALEERERRIAEERIDIQEATIPQPASVTTRMPNKMTVRTSDIRVSDRVCLSSITLAKHATVYNDLVDEIDPTTVKQLDSNLFLGDEISEVYLEIMKTVPTDHLDMENDDMIEPAAESVNLGLSLASSTLNRRRSERVINPELHRQETPPWGGMDSRDWAKNTPPRDVDGRNLHAPMMGDVGGAGGDPRRVEAALGPGDMGRPEALSSQFASWLAWWKNTINSDDYIKYLSTQESDYMGVIFHIYNSDDDDDDDDDASDEGPDVGGVPGTRTTKKKALAELQERERKRTELQAVKTEFKEGFWNCNSVLLGGLTGDPLSGDEEKTEVKPETPSVDQSACRTSKSRTRVVSRRSVLQASRESAAATRESAAETREGRASGGPDRTSGAVSKVESLPSGPKQQGEDQAPSAQDRLERVWTRLQMPDAQKLDMAIKYSGDAYHKKLEEAIENWERATELICRREALIDQLEAFERLASDPNRFFEKGQRGSSVARLHEAKHRSAYYKKIECLDDLLKKCLDHIKTHLDDNVTFRGRPYSDKMQWDRTEMLYWLQEERKQEAVQYEARLRQVTSARLTPLQALSQQQSIVM